MSGKRPAKMGHERTPVTSGRKRVCVMVFRQDVTGRPVRSKKAWEWVEPKQVWEASDGR